MSPISPRGAAWLAAVLIAFSPLYAGAAEIVHVVGKGQTLGRIAKRYRVKAATPLAPQYPTLGDVDSPQALVDYQAAKREHKARLRMKVAGPTTRS